MDFILRSLIDSDRSQAAEILFQSWHHVFAQWIPESVVERITKSVCEGMVSTIIEKQGEHLSYVAYVHRGELLGTLVWGLPREDKAYDAELMSMLVQSKALRKGVGRALFLKSIEEMRAKGIRNFYLNCIDANVSALKFYEAMGGKSLPGLVSRAGYSERRIYWNLN